MSDKKKSRKLCATHQEILRRARDNNESPHTIARAVKCGISTVNRIKRENGVTTRHRKGRIPGSFSANPPMSKRQASKYAHDKREIQTLVASMYAWTCQKCRQPLKSRFPRLDSQAPWVPVCLQNTRPYCEICWTEKQANNRRDRLEKKAKFWAFKYASLLESISSVDLDRMRKEIARKEREDREAALALAALHAQQPPKRQARTKRPQHPK